MQQIMNQSSRERAFLKVELKRLQSETDPCVILRMFWSKRFFYQIRTKEMWAIALSKLAIKIKAFKQAFEVADKLIDLN